MFRSLDDHQVTVQDPKMQGKIVKPLRDPTKWLMYKIYNICYNRVLYPRPVN
jgi:hypothetical protein